MFPYFGGITDLHQILAEKRPRLQEAYEDILGSKPFSLLEKADRELLSEHSFSRTLKRKADGFSTVITPDSKWNIYSKGSVSIVRLKTISYLSFSEEDFLRLQEVYEPWIPPWLGGYINYYNLFTLYALQDFPEMVVLQMIISTLHAPHFPLSLARIEQLATSHGRDMDAKHCLAFLGVWGLAIYSSFIRSNYRLNCAIFRYLGYKVPNTYPPKPVSGTIRHTFPTLQFEVSICNDNEFHLAPLRDHIQMMRTWQDCLHIESPIQEKFISSLRGVTSEKLPVLQS